MKAKIKALYTTILPNKRINHFIMILFILGFVSGAFFLTIISAEEKTIITSQITNFISNINNNSINKIELLKNTIMSTSIQAAIIWILGLSIIGVIINILFIYIKGFILGFTLSSIILTYKIKGILFSFIYVFPNELIKVLIILIIGVYSLTLSIDIIKELTKKKGNDLRKIFKRYIVVLIISIILIALTSVYEAFVIPIFLNVIY